MTKKKKASIVETRVTRSLEISKNSSRMMNVRTITVLANAKQVVLQYTCLIIFTRTSPFNSDTRHAVKITEK